MVYAMTYEKEIRWHGRGGHGLVSTSLLLCDMAVRKGYYAQSIPVFGAERRGAPTRVYTRISDLFIRKRSGIRNPDIVMLTDRSLLFIANPLDGLKRDGIVIINTDEITNEVGEALDNFKVIPVNAVDIALKADLKVGGIPVVTIPLLGALLKILGIIDLETAKEVVYERWRREIADRNMNALEITLEVVEVG